jgi:pimeloyl-ACP methyl ester carboxylesterase
MATPGGIEPFSVRIPQSEIDDLRARLGKARWPEKEPVDDWSQGVPISKLRALCDYWAKDYDWRRCEARLNAFPNFRTTIDGLSIHFIHRRSSRPDALPLIITHGWPGSVVEFMDVIDDLAEPREAGQLAFHVVAPSLPGFGFSDRPAETGWGYDRIALAWAELMRRLGYTRYGAQGGDWGSVVALSMGANAPAGLAGVHLNLLPIYPPADQADFSPAERAIADAMMTKGKADWGYQKIQGTRPQTLGYGLSDSPIGQAAWIYEKYQSWTQNNGDPEDALSYDQMLDNISLYWFTNTGASSARIYWELGEGFTPRPITLPLGLSLFPAEYCPARRWVEPWYKNITYWEKVERGGHFAAWEQPALFVRELRTFFATV